MASQRTKQKQRRRKTTALLLILSFLIAVIPAIPLTAEKADTDEITIVREEADRRNANERHYLCSDGSIMAVAFSGDVHYLDTERSTGPHLHYGVFLRKSEESYSANRNPLNPLLFIDPEYYANGESSRLPQVYGEVYS